MIKFQRPHHTVLSRWVDKHLLPPSPPDQARYSYTGLHKDIKPRHYLASVFFLVTYLSLYLVCQVVQVRDVPILFYSPLSITLELAEVSWQHLSHTTFTLGWILVSACYLVFKRFTRERREESSSPITRASRGQRLNYAAVREEQWFREGSQNWTWSGRLKSCLAFGMVHQDNLFYPIVTILPLAVAGLSFMLIYLRVYHATHDQQKATLTSALYHRCYNRVAFYAIPVFIVLSLLKILY